jgi:hypothetical protein
VLEPGCGSGNFIGAAPAGVDMVGVELDPITAQVAAHLYPALNLERAYREIRTPSGHPDGSGGVHERVDAGGLAAGRPCSTTR